MAERVLCYKYNIKRVLCYVTQRRRSLLPVMGQTGSFMGRITF
jgi:hypothetical protein